MLLQKEKKVVELTDGNEKAVLKDNKNAGDVITAEDLENPMHFDKLQDSLLIKLDESVLSRSVVIGATLKVDAVALTPITPNMLEGFEEEVCYES